MPTHPTVRRLVLLLTLAPSLALAQKGAAVAKSPPVVLSQPRLRVLDSLTINGRAEKLNAGGALLALPGGGILTWEAFNYFTAFDAAGKRKWSVEAQPRKTRELGDITAVGLRGKDTWLS